MVGLRKRYTARINASGNVTLGKKGVCIARIMKYPGTGYKVLLRDTFDRKMYRLKWNGTPEACVAYVCGMLSNDPSIIDVEYSGFKKYNFT